MLARPVVDVGMVFRIACSFLIWFIIHRGPWTSAYGIWNLWNELPDLIFPEPWCGKYSNPVMNFICHMHECKILFTTHLLLIWLNAYFNSFSLWQPECCWNFSLCYCLTSIQLWRRHRHGLKKFELSVTLIFTSWKTQYPLEPTLTTK
jgi:hypothetical protein